MALLVGTAVAGFAMAAAPPAARADIYRCLNHNQEESFSNVRCEEFGYITLERIEGVSEVKGKVAPPKSRRRGGDCYGEGVQYGREEIRWEEVPEECLAVPDFLAGWEDGLQKRPTADKVREACVGLCAEYGRQRGADDLRVCVEECVREAAGKGN